MTKDEVKDWLKRKRDFPIQYVTIDTCSKCTLQCEVCRRQFNKQRGIAPGEGGKDMPIADFKKMTKYFKAYSFCGAVSDPLFYKHLISCLKIIDDMEDETHTMIHIAATAKHRTREWYENAFAANKDATWIFALDGLPHESHKYRIGQDGEFMFEMMKLGVSMGAKIRWQYIVFRYNEDHIDEAYNMAKDHGMDFGLKITSRTPKGQKTLNPKWHVDEIL